MVWLMLYHLLIFPYHVVHKLMSISHSILWISSHTSFSGLPGLNSAFSLRVDGTPAAEGEGPPPLRVSAEGRCCLEEEAMRCSLTASPTKHSWPVMPSLQLGVGMAGLMTHPLRTESSGRADHIENRFATQLVPWTLILLCGSIGPYSQPCQAIWFSRMFWGDIPWSWALPRGIFDQRRAQPSWNCRCSPLRHRFRIWLVENFSLKNGWYSPQNIE